MFDCIQHGSKYNNSSQASTISEGHQISIYEDKFVWFTCIRYRFMYGYLNTLSPQTW